WNELVAHSQRLKKKHLKDLFQEDEQRFDRWKFGFENIVFDFSKNLLDAAAAASLFKLADECKLSQAIEAMFRGEFINETEHRSVLHIALRNFSGEPVYTSGKNVMNDVERVQRQMKDFCDRIHTGAWRGYTGKKIRYIVNIGIGGSDLGPQMVAEGLKPYWKEGISAHFVSNIDATHIAETLKKIDPEESLFLIASKTFTTQETMTNAFTARKWFLNSAVDEAHIAKHFIALSTNEPAATEFGIAKENIFEFWDWVGGRFSLWSAIGLSIALTTGYDNYEALLRGAHSVDQHFRKSKPEENIPVIMALISLWYINFFGVQSEAILPYDQYLHRFAAYFQQGNMESNGKSVDRNGEEVTYATGPVIWGEPGTNGQHAFYQLLHQGTVLVPCDFIAAAQSHNALDDHHEKLMSNFFAQTEALMNGKTEEEIEQELLDGGKTVNEIVKIAPYRTFSGNKPTNSILLKKITPYTLGQLVAVYEHKIFVQGVIWNIYSFDQWGVELGKQLANKILPELKHSDQVHSHDSSTNGLINAFKRFRSEGAIA
ncbi:MAG TPA: glucose-6-phosphate isomerase, partial [Chitinophagaceae bacterium]|nr:glucose-6-phosphate isomerase [Chitinophagaceae bacterium]